MAAKNNILQLIINKFLVNGIIPLGFPENPQKCI
jgi:hypothetical protein